MDDKVYARCKTCSWGCYGKKVIVENKIDQHEADNPEHTVEMLEVY